MAGAVADPLVRQIEQIEEQQLPSYRVLLFNDDLHSMDEVTLQIQKACGYSLEKAEAIMMDAHSSGQAIVYVGDLEQCEKVARVLLQIELRVTVEAA